VNGIGTGLDMPHLPPQHRYTGLDLTCAMLKQALPRASALNFCPVQGDAQRLPFADHSFDIVVLHLILPVVPEPAGSLQESARVTLRGGSLLVFDKFLKPGERARWKRALNPLARRIATRLDVVFEEMLAQTPALSLEEDEPALAGG
jgi:ubiquinone/menaquinone biosynthesis C-methylase UbiE